MLTVQIFVLFCYLPIFIHMQTLYSGDIHHAGISTRNPENCVKRSLAPVLPLLRQHVSNAQYGKKI